MIEEKLKKYKGIYVCSPLVDGACTTLHWCGTRKALDERICSRMEVCTTLCPTYCSTARENYCYDPLVAV